MSDALSRVKADLGREAVILHTRTIKRGGVWGIGAKPWVEITASSDAKVGGPPRAERTGAAGAGRGGAPAAGARAADAVGSSSAGADGAVATDAAFAGIRAEIEAVRGMVAELTSETRRAKQPNVPAELIDHYTELVGQAVANELAVQIVEQARERLIAGSAAGMPSPDVPAERWVRETLRDCIGEMVPPASPLALTAVGRPTVAALVGPTGVGKTTTIAKLAANMRLRQSRRVGLITTDTYRIAAVDQLRAYAQILDVPFAAVATADELRGALGRMRDRDLVLIDTAGRSQNDVAKLGELRAFVAAAQPDQVHLVLSGTCGEPAMRDAIRGFGDLGARHVIFTKLDEAVGFGVILNVLRTVGLRLSYLTNGQSVPDDIEEGDARRVAELIVHGAVRPPAGALV